MSKCPRCGEPGGTCADWCRASGHKEALSQQVEQIIDVQGIDGLLDLAGEVCELKATHIQANWQDRELAQWWRDRAVDIRDLAENTKKFA